MVHAERTAARSVQRRDVLAAAKAGKRLPLCATICHAHSMWNIVVGLIMLVGGLSGRLSLIGTDSSKALAVIGGAVLCWGLYQEWKRRKGPGE